MNMNLLEKIESFEFITKFRTTDILSLLTHITAEISLIKLIKCMFLLLKASKTKVINL